MTPTSPLASLTGTPARPSPLVRQVYGEPRFHTDGDVAAVAVAADGTVWSVDDAGLLRHWAADGRPLRRAFLSDLETLWAFAPGARLLASGNDDLLIWDVADAALVRRVASPSWVTAVGFGPSGQVVASGHDDGSVRVWEAAGLRPLGQVAAHGSAVSAVAFSPDGRWLATAGEDRAVRVWDAVTLAPVADFRSHTDRVPAVTWSADGRLLVSAGWDTSARVWRVGQPDPVMLLNSHADQVVAAAFAPAGRLLATADSDHDIHLWVDPSAGREHTVLRGHADEVRCLAFSPDGRRLVSAGADRVVHVWDVAGGRLVAGPNPAARHAVAVVPAAGRTLLASTAGGSAVRVYDADTAAEVPPAGTGPAHAVSADPTGRWLAVGGTDHVTRLYDLAAPAAPPRRLEATKPPIGALAFAPDGRFLAHTSPADGLVWLWRPTDPEAFLILIEAADGCTLEGLAVHPDGTRLAVGGVDYLSTGERDGAVCVWDVATRRKVATYDRGVYAVAFDPSGRYLAGAGLTDRVYLWDLTADHPDPVLELEGHTDRVSGVAFSPDGNYLVSGGDDLTVRVWDVLSGRAVVAREFDSAVQAVAFDPTGRHLFTGNGNTTCHRLDFAELLDD